MYDCAISYILILHQSEILCFLADPIAICVYEWVLVIKWRTQGIFCQLKSILAKLKTADIIYPEPMLTAQISYFYNMIKYIFCNSIIVITLNLNLEYSQLSEEQMMAQKEDFGSANVGLVIEESSSVSGGEDE